MDRPKSDGFVGFKCPVDLKRDALDLAALNQKTEADVWKEAMEFRLAFVRMVRLGYWQLRAIDQQKKVQPYLTLLGKVDPQ